MSATTRYPSMHKRYAPALLVFGVLLLAPLFLAACGSRSTGTLDIRVTDAPDPSITAILITASRVEVNQATGENASGWRTVITDETTFDLLKVVGREESLGVSDLAPGQLPAVLAFDVADQAPKVVDGVPMPRHPSKMGTQEPLGFVHGPRCFVCHMKFIDASARCCNHGYSPPGSSVRLQG